MEGAPSTVQQVHEVLLPLARILRAAERFAVPGQYGSILIDFYLQPTAALEVEIKTEWHTVTRTDTTKETGALVTVGNDRYNRVRMEVEKLAPKLKVSISVIRLRLTFQDGFLTTIEQVER